MMLTLPSGETPRKEWGDRHETMASSADWQSPSVPFLNPTGMERPLAISRWVCDSVVRAPMAAQGDEVGDVLRYDGVEKFGRGGQAELADVEQESARALQAGGDVVGAVEMRVGDEALPAHRGAGLLEVDAHDE